MISLLWACHEMTREDMEEWKHSLEPLARIKKGRWLKLHYPIACHSSNNLTPPSGPIPFSFFSLYITPKWGETFTSWVFGTHWRSCLLQKAILVLIRFFPLIIKYKYNIENLTWTTLKYICTFMPKSIDVCARMYPHTCMHTHKTLLKSLFSPVKNLNKSKGQRSGRESPEIKVI